MTSVVEHQGRLRSEQEWEPYLRRLSGLPGPRGNLELAEAVGREADSARIRQLLTYRRARPNTPEEFLLFCGVAALGRKRRPDGRPRLSLLRAYAADPRWRIREAVAVALQWWGDEDMRGLLKELRAWSRGSWLEKRAVAAAVAEPRLLRKPGDARSGFRLLDSITQSMRKAEDRRAQGFEPLRKTMGYAWSVLVAAEPVKGKPAFEAWVSDPHPEIRWVVRENLRKARLERLDRAWCADLRKRLELTSYTPGRPRTRVAAAKGHR